MTRLTSIYVLFDENGPRYVGKSVNIKVRLQCHKRIWKWITACIIIEVVTPNDRWQDRERFWIAYYGQWYRLENRHPGGTGAYLLSDETRRKLSEYAQKIGLQTT